MSPMADRALLGEVEQLVLLAVLRLGDEAYAVPIRALIKDDAGVSLSRGTIYVTLERLERKGYLRSRAAAGGAEREGRAKRFFTVDAEGLRALRRALDLVDRMRADLPALRPARAGR